MSYLENQTFPSTQRACSPDRKVCCDTYSVSRLCSSATRGWYICYPLVSQLFRARRWGGNFVISGMHNCVTLTDDQLLRLTSTRQRSICRAWINLAAHFTDSFSANWGLKNAEATNWANPEMPDRAYKGSGANLINDGVEASLFNNEAAKRCAWCKIGTLRMI